ncbi:hypothetical protein ACH5RR_030950 [Cinchona calisaya]|uniref:Uncharacterized protein n=1 Tax=Cinchona calisaya TaxID=153742 RepID=A0ABD2YEV6_9GENT
MLSAATASDGRIANTTSTGELDVMTQQMADQDDNLYRDLDYPISELQSIISSYWWGDADDWKSWNKMCIAKSDRSLGF